MGGEGGGLPCPIFENQKRALILEKKDSDFIDLFHSVSRRKIPKCLTLGPFFLAFLMKCWSKYPNSMKPPLPWKISGFAPVTVFCREIYSSDFFGVFKKCYEESWFCVRLAKYYYNFSCFTISSLASSTAPVFHICFILNAYECNK